MEKQDKLNELQSYRFAAYDMLLYLDTHPNDKKAFEIYQDLVKKYKTLLEDYETNCKPLCAFSSANFDSFNWLSSPWPWEKEDN